LQERLSRGGRDARFWPGDQMAIDNREALIEEARQQLQNRQSPMVTAKNELV